jgi:hypothetical protein
MRNFQRPGFREMVAHINGLTPEAAQPEPPAPEPTEEEVIAARIAEKKAQMAELEKAPSPVDLLKQEEAEIDAQLARLQGETDGKGADTPPAPEAALATGIEPV